jgi:hypothetical protein
MAAKSNTVYIRRSDYEYTPVAAEELYDLLRRSGYGWRIPKERSADRVNRIISEIKKAGSMHLGGRKLPGTSEKVGGVTLFAEDERIMATNTTTGAIEVGVDRALLLRELGVKRIVESSNPTIRAAVGKIKIGKFSLNPETRYVVYVTLNIIFSASEERRTLPIFVEFGRDIETSMKERADQYAGDYYYEIAGLRLIPLADYERNRNARYNENMGFMELNTEDPRDITSLFREEIDLNASSENCVYTAITKKFCVGKNKISQTAIDQKYGRTGWTLGKLQKFCNDYNIKFRAFNINAQLICENTTSLSGYTLPPIPNPNESIKYKRALNCILHDNHIFLMKNAHLNKLPAVVRNFCQSTKSELLDIVRRVEPNNVWMDSTGICEVLVKNTLYHTTSSPETKECYDILQKYGLSDKVTPKTKYTHVLSQIEKLYNLDSSITSFFPVPFTKTGFIYGKSTGKNETSFDMNSCYPVALERLPFLIQCNYAYHYAAAYTGGGIIDHYLYIVEPAMSSILLPNTSVYSGSHVKYCMEVGLKMTIKEQIETTRHSNYYTPILMDSRRILDKSQFKTLWNRAIGIFNHKPSSDVKETIEYSHTGNDTESKSWLAASEYNFVDQICTDGAVTIINYNEDGTPNYTYTEPTRESRYICYKRVLSAPKYSNRSPIYIQILDQSRVYLYEKMKEITEKYNCEVVQVKTDCFTVNKKLECEAGDGWKIIECTPNKHIHTPVNAECSFFQRIAPGTLYATYAGVGKSHYIQNEVIPHKYDPIVLCPTHSSLVDYKKKRFNPHLSRTRTEFNFSTNRYDKITEEIDITCDIIHKYSYASQYPRQRNIIIDEIALVNDYDFLWGLSKYALVTAFGDYEQLLPVGSDRPYNAPQYINALFARVDTKTLTINRRNDFSFDFYDKMIWDDCDSSIIIKTYCKTDLADYQPTDICIARTNAECDKINADILEMLFDTRDMCVGCKVECRTNNLRDIDVYNHYQFEIVSMNDEQVILSDNIRELTITPRQLRNNFTPAYCVTLHSAQGKSYPVVRYMSENLDLTGRELYTLISRIKTK